LSQKFSKQLQTVYHCRYTNNDLMDTTIIQQQIEQAWQDRALLKNADVQATIRQVIELLDKGTIRIAERLENNWKINEWIKKAVILYFPIQQMQTIEVGPFEFYDKIPLR
jgi:2,3,4,5-tetrahydropyridine-2,6-dicarboxylate N-succinyltransferase